MLPISILLLIYSPVLKSTFTIPVYKDTQVNCTEYWLYYETWGIFFFHRQPSYIFTHPLIRICCNHKKETVHIAVLFCLSLSV